MTNVLPKGWNQLNVDLSVIKDFTAEDADRWLRRHGYGPALAAEAMKEWNALGKKVEVKPKVEVKVVVNPKVEVKKADKKWSF